MWTQSHYEGRRRSPLTRRQVIWRGLGLAGITATGIIAPDVYSRYIDHASEPEAKPIGVRITPDPNRTTGGRTVSSALFETTPDNIDCYIRKSPEDIGPVPFTYWSAWNPDGTEPQFMDFMDWVRSLDGERGPMDMTIALTSPKTLVVQDISFRVVSLNKPTLDVCAVAEPRHAGDFWSETLSVNFDTEPPSLERSGDDPDTGMESHWNFPLSVGNSDTYFLTLQGMSSRSVQWVIQVDYIADGHERSVDIDDNGRPFEFVADKDLAARWNWETLQWDKPKPH